ncbi:MAG: Na(+)-translocating NADH-quinone reductase subunit F [Bacteroidia bacterium]|nr:Na(+)-translocating NADH-quinone reductase subunit F [Bacteroidia bacterium]NND26442.1 Na(+)-translocating NADH-quinone reductase subunit F [Flavobacteriaceae bacterium]MBT8279738.1 Na(+)-translocating NADH-quinone reductase subunit F [Bacteroidia bacterium]NNK59232.1 Na(+)-translocating NADH-quinone reductase subunit F [Flavobacteriaceae bacterium]NNL32910.1 Na(+)-translocating NADH-quinone reductase subunit F [Flavobacteriaceae bacterium]
MMTTKRFDQAVDKLYQAFHNNSLHPECAMQCAVGSICDGRDFWKHFSDQHGSIHLNYVGKVNQSFGRKFNGYSPQELLDIEAIFLKACGYSLPLDHNGVRPLNPSDKHIQFKGLSAVISYLCRIDQISDVMDYHKLLNFEYQNSDYSISHSA